MKCFILKRLWIFFSDLCTTQINMDFKVEVKDRVDNTIRIDVEINVEFEANHDRVPLNVNS